MLFTRKHTTMPAPEETLPGRPGADARDRAARRARHAAPSSLPRRLRADRRRPRLLLGGRAEVLAAAPGVWTTAVGYAGGETPNPTYEEACSGLTGHTEAVLAVFDPAATSYPELLRLFWESHDPTQGMQQGNDVGTQYRSAIYWQTPARSRLPRSPPGTRSRPRSGTLPGHGAITTEIAEAGPFYYAEAYHQQYLARNPGGYCGLGGTGVRCPIGIAAT